MNSKADMEPLTPAEYKRNLTEPPAVKISMVFRAVFHPFKPMHWHRFRRVAEYYSWLQEWAYKPGVALPKEQADFLLSLPEFGRTLRVLRAEVARELEEPTADVAPLGTGFDSYHRQALLHQQIGMMQRLSNRYEEAAKEYEKAENILLNMSEVDFNFKDNLLRLAGDARYFLGELCQLQGDVAGAQRDYDVAKLRMNAGCPPASPSPWLRVLNRVVENMAPSAQQRPS